MWMMDRFFDGEFLSYGWRVMNLADQPQEQRYDPMVRFSLKIETGFLLEELNLNQNSRVNKSKYKIYLVTTEKVNESHKMVIMILTFQQVYVFPRITKCIFHKYGASGSIQKHDSLCVLPLNIVNEKTYIFIWFWFIILLLMLIGLFVYR